MLLRLQQEGYAEEAKRIVVLRGCHLNDKHALRRISSIFQGFEELEEGPPALFVFMGPFFERDIFETSRNAADMRMGFAALAAIVSVFPNIQVHVPSAVCLYRSVSDCLLHWHAHS